MTGEQFALGEAVEALRALKSAPLAPEEVRVAATDPLNLVGILTPGPRIPSVSGHALVYRNGVPLAAPIAADARGVTRLTPIRDSSAPRTSYIMCTWVPIE